MTRCISNIDLLPAVLEAPRAVVMVAVAWSPYHQFSRKVLDGLMQTQTQWSPDRPVSFFAIWPEEDRELNQWYEKQCQTYSPQFELHGHGYAPFWWLTRGKIVDCRTKPFEEELETLQKYSARAFKEP